MACIFSYFLNCLNSNISTMRSNAWLCLHIILNDHPQMSNIETLLSRSDSISEPDIELILTRLAQYKSLEQIQSLIKQTLSETCHFETNINVLHHSILFIIDHCQIESTNDLILLSNLAQALNRRHSILYLLIQFDKQYKLIEKFFHLMMQLLIKKVQFALHHPIHIESTGDNLDEQTQANVRVYLVLPNFNDEQIRIFKQLHKSLNINDDLKWTNQKDKQYIEIDSKLVELLLIFLAYFDFNDQQLKHLHELASLIQEFFLNTSSTPYFSAMKQISRPIPVKQNQEEVSKYFISHFRLFFHPSRSQPPVIVPNISNNSQSKTPTNGKIRVNDAYLIQLLQRKFFFHHQPIPPTISYRSKIKPNNHCSLETIYSILSSNPRTFHWLSNASIKHLYYPVSKC